MGMQRIDKQDVVNLAALRGMLLGAALGLLPKQLVPLAFQVPPHPKGSLFPKPIACWIVIGFFFAAIKGQLKNQVSPKA
jgi:hypothetical protein